MLYCVPVWHSGHWFDTWRTTQASSWAPKAPTHAVALETSFLQSRARVHPSCCFPPASRMAAKCKSEEAPAGAACRQGVTCSLEATGACTTILETAKMTVVTHLCARKRKVRRPMEGARALAHAHAPWPSGSTRDKHCQQIIVSTTRRAGIPHAREKDPRSLLERTQRAPIVRIGIWSVTRVICLWSQRRGRSGRCSVLGDTAPPAASTRFNAPVHRRCRGHCNTALA